VLLWQVNYQSSVRLTTGRQLFLPSGPTDIYLTPENCHVFLNRDAFFRQESALNEALTRATRKCQEWQAIERDLRAQLQELQIHHKTQEDIQNGF